MATIPAESLIFTNGGSTPVAFTDPDGNILTPPSVPTFTGFIGNMASLDDGRYCYSVNDVSNKIRTTDSQFVQTGESSVSSTSNGFEVVSDFTTAFYRIETVVGTTIGVRQIDPDTAVQTQIGTFIWTSGSITQLLGISPDGLTVYFEKDEDVWSAPSTGTGSAATKIIDNTDPDVSLNLHCGCVLRTGHILLLLENTNTNEILVKRYSAAGSPLATYTIIAASGTDHDALQLHTSTDDLSFWAATQEEAGMFSDTLTNVLISDGSVLHTFDSGDGSVFAASNAWLVMPVAFGTAPPQPTLTFPDTPGEVGIAYSAALVAADGTPPYGPYTITVGTLPYGLSLDAATGIISGIPTNVQTANFTAQVTDDNSQTADCLCSIAIGANMTIKSVGLIDPVLQFEDGDGLPYASGSVAFYAVGTSNLLDVYSDDDLATPLPNPVPLNAAGRSSTSITGVDTPVYCQQKTYDYSLFDADSVLVYGPITFSGSQWPGSIQGQSVMSPAANANAYANRFTTTINKAVSGTHALFAGTRFDIPTIGAAASTLTESATVYIEGPPATGTNPYALHVASGTVKFDGPVVFAGNGGSFGNYRPVTANTNAVAGDRIVVTANTPTITLPAASANLNAFVVVLNNGTGLVTISPDGSDKVGLATSQTLNVATATAQGDSLTLVSDGISNWNIV